MRSPLRLLVTALSVVAGFVVVMSLPTSRSSGQEVPEDNRTPAYHPLDLRRVFAEGETWRVTTRSQTTRIVQQYRLPEEGEEAEEDGNVLERIEMIGQSIGSTFYTATAVGENGELRGWRTRMDRGSTWGQQIRSVGREAREPESAYIPRPEIGHELSWEGAVNSPVRLMRPAELDEQLRRELRINAQRYDRAEGWVDRDSIEYSDPDVPGWVPDVFLARMHDAATAPAPGWRIPERLEPTALNPNPGYDLSRDYVSALRQRRYHLPPRYAVRYFVRLAGVGTTILAGEDSEVAVIQIANRVIDADALFEEWAVRHGSQADQTVYFDLTHHRVVRVVCQEREDFENRRNAERDQWVTQKTIDFEYGQFYAPQVFHGNFEGDAYETTFDVTIPAAGTYDIWVESGFDSVMEIHNLATDERTTYDDTSDDNQNASALGLAIAAPGNYQIKISTFGNEPGAGFFELIVEQRAVEED